MYIKRLGLLAVVLGACASDSLGSEDAEVQSGRARIHTFTGEDGQFYFNVKGANGEILLSSEGYTSTSGRENGIESVKTNGSRTAQYEVRTAMDGQYYLVLKAANNQIIADGETYVSKSNAERARDRVARLFTNIKISEAPRVSRFETFKSDLDSQYYFHLRAGNGEIVLQSEGYTSKQSAEGGIAAVRQASVGEAKQAADGQYYFVVTASNGEPVGVSQMYGTEARAKQAASRVEELASQALVTVDATTVE